MRPNEEETIPGVGGVSVVRASNLDWDVSYLKGLKFPTIRCSQDCREPRGGQVKTRAHTWQRKTKIRQEQNEALIE